MSIKTMNTTPAADGFTMPAEWAHQQAVWMIWPFRPDNWREAGRFAQATFAKVADAIGGATPVFMGCRPSLWSRPVASCPPTLPWLRWPAMTAGPATLAPPSSPTPQASAVGGLGLQRLGRSQGVSTPWNQDEEVAARMLEQHGMGRYDAPLILEGAPSMWMAKAPA